MERTGFHYTGVAFCILLFAATGSQSSSILLALKAFSTVPTSYPAPIFAFYLGMEITNRVFNNSLLNPSTLEYQKMYAEVSGALNLIFNCSYCDTRNTYRGVTEIWFSNGSVVANCTILFQTIFINNIVVKFLFLRDNHTDPNGLKINKQFTGETVTPIWNFPKTTTPMAKTAPSISSKPTGGVSLTAARTNLSTTKDKQMTSTTHTQSHATMKRTITLSPSITSQKPLITVTGSSGNTTTTTTKRGSGTEPVLLPTSSAPVAAHSNGGVPGWAIALLVLASVILLILLILLLLLICWCCRKKEKDEKPSKEGEHVPYERTSFKEPLSTPTYSPITPQKTESFPVFLGEPEGKKNGSRTGIYVVNPER